MRRASRHTGRCSKVARRTVWLVLLTCLVIIGGVVATSPASGRASISLYQRDRPGVESDVWTLTAVEDWQQGLTNGLLISNNAGGELRLDAGMSEGTFISDPFEAIFSLNAAGAFWRARFPQGTDITLELRGRSDAPSPGDIASDAGWGPWFPLVAGDARSQADDGAFATPDVLAFPVDTRYLQVRASLSSTAPRASPVLSELTIAYLDTTEGPVAAPDFLRVPINTGPETLTQPPEMVSRPTWSARQEAIYPERFVPRGVIVHQLDVTMPATATLAFLRSLLTYQTEVLGWDDLVYHYVIDETGTLYEGRLGGPTAAVSRLSGNDQAVQVALIGDLDEPPDEAAQQTLVELLAWIGQAYDIPPTGQHRVLVNGDVQVRDNITAHSEIVPEAPDPGQPVLDLLPALRTRADEATVRARWYFAEGNVQDYVQQLAFFNPGTGATDATIKLFPRDTAEPQIREVAIDSDGRELLLINDIVSDTTDLAWVVESSEPLIVERTIGLPNDLDHRPGASQTSRVWYFAEGSTESFFQTFLVLFNPQDVPADTTITYMRGDGSLAEQQVRLAARQRLAINVGDVLPDAGFGMRIVASQPIVAERTMRFGSGDSGLHSNPGITELSRQWYFAEGTTQAPFEMRLLLLNPNRQSTIASVTFMTRDGTSLTRRYALPATTRLVVDVNEVVPELGVATVIEADRPLAVERGLYISSSGAEVAEAEAEPAEDVSLQIDVPSIIGSVTSGATAPAYSWRFADGRVADAQQYLLISNPGRSQARVTVEFLLSGEDRSVQSIVMPAGSRYTLPVSELYADQPTVAIVIRSTQPVVAERSIFPTSGVGAAGATTSIGIPGP